MSHWRDSMDLPGEQLTGIISLRRSSSQRRQGWGRLPQEVLRAPLGELTKARLGPLAGRRFKVALSVPSQRWDLPL